MEEIEQYSHMILELRDALEEAIREIREHNGEYHHTTSEEKIKFWEGLL